jgi:hypothetical protein
MFSTGSLGALVTQDFGMWACFQAHSCVTVIVLLVQRAPSAGDDAMCYMYHEKEELWYPWALKSEVSYCAFNASGRGQRDSESEQHGTGGRHFNIALLSWAVHTNMKSSQTDTEIQCKNHD